MARSTPYAHFLGALASWFGAWGVNQVLFQWLVTEWLASPPALVGTAQMALMLPSLLFLLVGGAVADRLDPRRLLVAIHAATGLAALGLWLLVLTDALSYPSLIVYALVIGTLQAFAMPARDTQLSDVVGSEDLSRSVAGLTMAQHMAQIAGALLGGTAGVLGAGWPIAGQSALLFAGMWPASRLPGRPADPDRQPMRLSDLRAGIAEVLRSPVLRPVSALSVVTGAFFIGPFLVVLPLIVRDVYGGGAAEMGILSAMFPLGAVLGGIAIVRAGGIRRNGRALALGQMLGAAALGSIAFGLPFEGTVVCVLVWGIAGSLFINTGRTLFQMHASEANRGRVLSVYTLGLLGASPPGSLLSGFLVEEVGPHLTLALDAIIALTILAYVALRTRLWSLR